MAHEFADSFVVNLAAARCVEGNLWPSSGELILPVSGQSRTIQAWNVNKCWALVE